MKRNENKVPKFDDIIFENRNRKYGAYDLRRRYNSVTSLSILGAVTMAVVIVLALFVKSETGQASDGPHVFVIARFDDFIPVIPDQPEPKLPSELQKIPQNVAPVVVTDTTDVTSFLPITDDLVEITKDGDVNDTVSVIPVNDNIVPAEPTIFIGVEEMPEFPGGQAALLEYIGKNTSYPQEAADNNVEGRVVLKFVVKPDGSVGKIEVVKSVDPLLDKEAVRVVSTLPRFKPGKQNGEAVHVWFSVPVLFKINN